MNTSAAPAVSAVRAAPRDKLLAPERHGAVAPFSCCYFNLCFVNEFHGCKKQKAPSVSTGLFGRLLVFMR
jgi:hypothetical protein